MTRRKRRGTRCAHAYTDREVIPVNHLTIPERLRLDRRPTASPRADELPVLRDEQGRVLATVEQWAPEAGTATRAN